MAYSINFHLKVFWKKRPDNELVISIKTKTIRRHKTKDLNLWSVALFALFGSCATETDCFKYETYDHLKTLILVLFHVLRSCVRVMHTVTQQIQYSTCIIVLLTVFLASQMMYI